MSEHNDGGPAFPVGSGDMRDPTGMSLRDWFAGQALAGMLAYSHVNPTRGNYHENCSIEIAAREAFVYADAMLAARAQERTT